jgi:hypothetical protein
MLRAGRLAEAHCKRKRDWRGETFSLLRPA